MAIDGVWLRYAPMLPNGSAYPRRPALLLAVIYIAFVALGLPDTVLGAVWPAVRLQFGLALDAAGQAVLLTTVGVTAASLATGRLIERCGTGTVLVGSSLLAALALLMNALAPRWSFMLLTAVLAGVAGGAIDTAMNRFVARHYSARHMNWLHGFWGLGATLGPLTAALAIRETGSWRSAYAILSGAELLLALLFLATLARWREGSGVSEAEKKEAKGAATAPLVPAARASVATFAVYGGLEASIGLWSASYLVGVRGVSTAAAGAAVAGYWGGITAGRLLLGGFAARGRELLLVGAGLWVVFPALLVLALPRWPLPWAVAALALLGVALGPIYPTLMHDTARRYGEGLGPRLVGYQVAACALGVATMPWLIGVITRFTTITLLPVCLGILAAAVLVLERARR